MMYQIEALKADVEMVKAMLNVIEPFKNVDSFRYCDIEKEVKKGYRKSPYVLFRRSDFTGSSLAQLVRRGLIEVVGTEDYIYEDRRGKKRVGTRNIYRHSGLTIEDYKTTLAKMTYQKIMSL